MEACVVFEYPVWFTSPSKVAVCAVWDSRGVGRRGSGQEGVFRSGKKSCSVGRKVAVWEEVDFSEQARKANDRLERGAG